MKRLKILTILVVMALGISAGTAYAQFGGGPGAGSSTSALGTYKVLKASRYNGASSMVLNTNYCNLASLQTVIVDMHSSDPTDDATLHTFNGTFMIGSIHYDNDKTWVTYGQALPDTAWINTTNSATIKSIAGVANLGVALNSVAASTGIKIIRKGQGISSISEGTNIVNVTLCADYPNNSLGVGNLKVGQKIVIGGTANYDGTFTIATVTNQSNFSYAQTSASRGTETFLSPYTTAIAGGDYSSLTTWDSDGSNTTAECYNDWGTTGLEESLVISGNNATSTHYKKITVPLSERNNGTAGTGFKIAGTVTIGDNYAAVEDVEVTSGVTVSSGAALTTGGNMLFSGGLTVASGGTLNADTSNMVIKTAFSNTGTINAQGSMMTFDNLTTNFTQGTFNPGQASIIFSGTSSCASNSAVVFKAVKFASGTTTISGSVYILNTLILDMGNGSGNKITGGSIMLYGDIVCNSGDGLSDTTVNFGGANHMGYISGPATGTGGILPPLVLNTSSAYCYAKGTLTFQNVSIENFQRLTFTGGYTYAFRPGSHLAINYNAGGRGIYFTGTSTSNMVKLRSSTPGSYWYLDVNGGTVTPVYTDVQDCSASSTVTATSLTNVNSGHNVNWTFGGDSVTWIADEPKKWNDPTAWSTGVVPITGLGVIHFTDAHRGNCTLDRAPYVSSIASNGYAGTLDTLDPATSTTYNITLTGWQSPRQGLDWRSGTLKANGSTIAVRSILNLTGGTFIPGTSTIEIYADNSGNSTYIWGDIPAFNILDFKNGADVKLGSTITVGATSTLKFSGGQSTPIALNWNATSPVGAGPQWYIDNTAGGTVTATYVHPTNCNVITGGNDARKITATSSIDKGNNTNWIFSDAPLSYGSVAPASLVAGSKGKVTATFKTRMTTLYANSPIEITFPAGFTLGSDVNVSATSLNGTFSTSVSGQTVTLTRTGGTNLGTNYYTELVWSITLDNVTNPAVAGTTGDYTILVKSAANGSVLQRGVFPGSVIVDNPLSSLTCSSGTAGTIQAITWNSSPTNKPASVNIKYSTDSGATYPNLIAKVTNNSGVNTYNWTPLSVLSNVRIKVEDALVPQVFVASQSDIAIAAPTMTITSPTDVTEWETDTWHTITWTPSVTTNPAITRVKLEYSYNGGTTWATRHDSLPNTGSYDWNMTDVLPSPTMKFRITGRSGPAITYGGSAGAANKAGVAWLESGNKVLAIAINSSFTTGANVLTISGLKFNNFAAAASVGQLTCTTGAIDSKYIRINDNSVYSGGYGDGWSYAGCTN